MSLTLDSSRPVVLASGSAARAALLRNAGLAFTVQRPLVDEEDARATLTGTGVSGEDAATALAELKAAQVSRASGGCLVIGADQILELDGTWLAKPADRAGATTQLQALRGRRHRLVSAAVLFVDGHRIWQAAEAATLSVRDFSDRWLEDYLDTAGERVLDCVGGYQIEGLGSLLMAAMTGSYFAVLGLPLLPLLQALRDQRVLAA